MTPILFLHIPKTAGITLRSIIARQYGASAVWSIDENHLDSSIANFLAQPKPNRDAIRVIQGHFVFGIHERLGVFPRYITMLREPVQRVISHYHHVLKHKDHYLHDYVLSRHMSLDEYVQCEVTSELDNDQTRFLSGVGSTVRVGECTREMLALANRNLDSHFAIAGICERFDESVLLMQRELQWRRYPCYYRENVGSRPDRDQVPDHTLFVIRERNALDIELYRQVSATLDSKLIQQGASFKYKLWTFNVMKALYEFSADPRYLEAGFSAKARNQRTLARHNFLLATLHNPLVLKNPGVAVGLIEATLGSQGIHAIRRIRAALGRQSNSP